jgi:hypothetical protein
MNDVLIFIVVIALWLALQAWILPKLGVST